MTSVAQAGRRFQFLQEIASGGFGCVYLAKLLTPDGDARIVAVKLLHRRWTDNVEIASRMRDEARLLSRLRHEHIVEVLDFALIEGRSAVVMEYLDAVDVRVIVDHCRESGVRMPLAAALEICAAVASALDAAYNDAPVPGRDAPVPGRDAPVPGRDGQPTDAPARPLHVIHRDIKPSNLMVDPRGGVKVLDFGIARAEFEQREAKTAELAFGSLEYMPPERLFFEPESAASDVYSLGTALYEMLALEKLGKAKLRQSEQEKFLAERLADLTERYVLSDQTTPGLEVDLVALLKSMLAFDESNRPTSAAVSQRMRALAGRAGSPSLAGWAAKVVPKLLDEVRTSKQGSGTLVGQTVTEDPPAPLRPRDRFRDEPSDDGTNDTELFHPVDTDTTGDGELDATSRDDTRWMELKRVALASLGEATDVEAAVVRELQVEPIASASGQIREALIGTPGSAPIRAPMPRAAEPARPSEPASDRSPAGQITAGQITVKQSVPTGIRLPRSFPGPGPGPGPGPSAPATEADEPEPTARMVTRGPESAPPVPTAIGAPAADSTLFVQGGRQASTSQPGRDNRPRSLPGEEDPEGAPTLRFHSDSVGGEQHFELSSRSDPREPIPRSEVDTIVVPPRSQSRTPDRMSSRTPPERISTDGTPGPSPRRIASARSLTPTPPPPPVDDGMSAPLAYAISAVLLLVTSALVLLTVVFVGAVGIATLSRPARPVVPSPVEGAETSAEAGGQVAPPPDGASSTVFESAFPGTRRMTARCGDTAVSGADRVVVPGNGFAECTVTAIDGARQRRTAVVKIVEPRSYRCFEGNESICH